MGEDLKAGELNFINEYTRTLLVEWGVQSITGGKISDPQVDADAPGSVFVEHAFTKGWIGKRKPHTLTQGGFKAAASYLRR